MARLSPARRVALELAGECRQRHARARDLMRTSAAMDGLAPRDRALATRLVLGTQRARGLLDATIESHLTRGHLEPRLRDALRISTFEVLYLQTPTRAAVSQGVELAGLASRRARGLANAVLRRIAAEDLPRMDAARARLRDQGEKNAAPSAEDVALVAALPQWLARALVESLETGARGLALAAMEPPVPTVAANLNLATADDARALLQEAGLEPTPLPWPGCLALGRQAGLAASGLVESARVLPADPAAQVVSWLAAPAADVDSMLEVGQGRATKTLLMAGANAALGGHVILTSVDSVEFKAKLARERTQGGGLANRAQTVVLDGTLLGSPDVPEPLRRSFPHVFVDAPCSGTGTMRRHPEVAWVARVRVRAGARGRPAVAPAQDARGRVHARRPGRHACVLHVLRPAGGGRGRRPRVSRQRCGTRLRASARHPGALRGVSPGWRPRRPEGHDGRGGLPAHGGRLRARPRLRRPLHGAHASRKVAQGDSRCIKEGSPDCSELPLSRLFSC
ncbi:MAG: hypothetical protein DUD33_00200 [Coriobacteriaceae bacterium]|nr:MAG: hypothetical protein DUD33_00200 [Coriobacteriaceae bacterium]